MKRLWIILVLLIAATAMAQDPGWIGVTVVDDAVGGARIQSVQPDSPAAQAGLQANDILTQYNGQTVTGVLQLTRLVQETPVGRTVEVRFRRGDDNRTVQVTTDRTPFGSIITSTDGLHILSPGNARTRVSVAPFAANVTPFTTILGTASTAGLRVISLSPQLRDFFGVTGTRGVLVDTVDAGSAAANAGVQAGDVITSVSGMTVSSPAEFTSRMRSSGTNITLEIVRDKTPRTLSLEGVTGR